MDIRIMSSGEDLRRYSEWILTHPQGSLWQSLEWKHYQESLGRSVQIYAAEEAGAIIASAMVIIDRTAFGLSTWDIPRGPVGEVTDGFLQRIIDDAKNDRCMTIFLSAPLTQPKNHTVTLAPSCRCEQLEATIILDITQSEEELLAAMHQKARYNMKIARKHEVTVTEHTANDQKALDSLYTLLKKTGRRDGFTHLPKSHYEAFLKHLGHSFFLMAVKDDKPIAGLLGVIWNGTGIYYYGASSYEDRALMAPYLLQWEAVRYCKAQGCHSYDLLGIAPPDAPPDNPWRGITDFKSKFGGNVLSYPPEQCLVLRPMAQRLIEWKRKIIG